MDMVLENNNFSFNGKHYVQTEGTAIGSHLGMNYASVYLGSWEKTLFENSKTKPMTYFRPVLCTNLSLFCRVQLLLKRPKNIISRLNIVNQLDGRNLIQ
jgi:hypothetical protein